MVTVFGKVENAKNVFTSRIKIQEIYISDIFTTNDICKLTFFNQPFLLQSFKKNVFISVSGVAEKIGDRLQFKSPEYEMIKSEIRISKFETNLNFQNSNSKNSSQQWNNETIEQLKKSLVHTGRLIPIYPETQGISSKRLRALIFPLLKDFPIFFEEYLPNDLTRKENLIDLVTAYSNIHYPETQEMITKANFRLAFDELLIAQLTAFERKNQWTYQKTKNIDADKHQSKIQKFIEKLPFTLTASQNRAVAQIFSDLDKNHPMNRLLEGDVGSGKTVVAAAAMYLAYLNGFSSALMCPTEILANQHYATINKLLGKFKIPICLITSSTQSKHGSIAQLLNCSKQKSNNRTIEQSNNGPGIFIGTHALIEDKVNIPNLNFVVIDEQHRFGVEQRGKLVKKGLAPHILTMTATPIPRTIALTFYGDLDLSILEDMPQKKQIKTWVVPPEKRTNAYEWIQKQIEEQKLQVFIVCPFISQSETMESVKSAKEEYAKLQKIFKTKRLELLTGKTKAAEKDRIMKNFERHESDILVCTPVVEVGIDIPNAGIILIEGSERFGLAQLHQLRGRVGRRGQTAYCLLFTTDNCNPAAGNRLKNMEKIDNGLKLSEIDLKIRGMGNIFGRAQHGQIEFKKADISNLYLVEKAKENARELFKNIEKYPILKTKLKSGKIENIINN